MFRGAIIFFNRVVPIPGHVVPVISPVLGPVISPALSSPMHSPFGLVQPVSGNTDHACFSKVNLLIVLIGNAHYSWTVQ